ncbi:hypothetical protein JYU34_011935 [Plutella xylostella]|uniref:PHD finger protein 12 n=1 Tax=Plutella xylostella TaxID=51655 RepID=A0ABQ7QDX5_PLUXY|nr:hypothetical protein JYU34_011935 [Plutella xylostella]
MSSVGYDLDTSGGLMPLIRALIKPPDEDANGQKSKKPQHPYYKRPGKGHNHDSCDACGEGGDLICCDRCPASFHLGCYDPPLDENDIPAGQWLCKHCHGMDAERQASSRGSRAPSPSDRSDTSEKRTRSLRNSSAKKKAKEEVEEEKPQEKAKPEEQRELTPMEVLVKAARIMNPKQFELPREMRIPCPFPGTDKEPPKNGNGSGVVTVDGGGCVPLPARACFVCGATCHRAPLLQCDYCPLLFHQDCLDPPMTALPTGRWMCPNHVEQYIDWKLVNSISATERVALWERFSGPLDQHEVKLAFLRRARAKRPPFRVKVPVSAPGRVVVPGMVRAHYRCPPPLPPTRREYVRCNNVMKQLQAAGAYDSSDEEEKRVICLNLQCPQYQSEGGRCPHDKGGDGGRKRGDRGKLKGVSECEGERDLLAIERGADDQPDEDPHDEEHPRADDDEESSDTDLDELLSPVKRRRRDSGDKGQRRRDQSFDKLTLNPDINTEELVGAAARQLARLDRRLVLLLACQRLQQVATGELLSGPWQRARLSGAAERAVRASVSRARLAKHGFRHVALPSQLLSRQDHERIASCVWGSPPAAPRSPPPPPAHDLSDAAVRAALCPIESPAKSGLGDALGQPVAMRRSKLTLGTAACDLSPRLYRPCRYVSPRHATIFYDEVTGHFELINYSEWGTLVNGVMYACDLREWDAPPAPPLPLKHANKQITITGDVTAPSAPPCRCAAPPPPAPAWEGSALLTHGALIQLGCVQFVFCVTDSPAFPGKGWPDEPSL